MGDEELQPRVFVVAFHDVTPPGGTFPKPTKLNGAGKISVIETLLTGPPVTSTKIV